jgi:nuclear GTP-binding protein
MAGASTLVNRKAPTKGVGKVRSKSTINRLAMYKARAIRDKDGKIIGGDLMTPGRTHLDGRIAPNRKWFGNTRVVGQKALETYRTEMQKELADPFSVVLKQRKLPMGLLSDKFEGARSHILDTQSFESTFGKTATRKKPEHKHTSLEDLAAAASTAETTYDSGADNSKFDPHLVAENNKVARGAYMERAQTHRVYSELYKVIDCSDVLLQVLDARDPMGTRSAVIEAYMRKPANQHKALVFVLNKVDLVPTWVTARWCKLLNKEYPTVAFHASMTNPFGKGALIGLLRQFATLHKDRKQISVGLCGFPNCGKSSIINALRAKKVCNVAPIPGETKVWQYVTLTSRVYLVDCPGVVYPGKDMTDEDLVLRGVLRVENLEDPETYIPGLIARTKPEYINRTYGLNPERHPEHKWDTPDELLTLVARRAGRLLKGAEPDTESVARKMIMDLFRGRIPYFILPPMDNWTAERPVRMGAAAGLEPSQKFGTIAVRLGFLDEDAQAPEGLEASDDAVATASAVPETSVDDAEESVSEGAFDAAFDELDGADPAAEASDDDDDDGSLMGGEDLDDDDLDGVESSSDAGSGVEESDALDSSAVPSESEPAEAPARQSSGVEKRHRHKKERLRARDVALPDNFTVKSRTDSKKALASARARSAGGNPSAGRMGSAKRRRDAKRDAEGLRSSSILGESDLRMAGLAPKPEHKRHRKQRSAPATASGAKTGKHFYSEAKVKKAKIERVAGRRIA